MSYGGKGFLYMFRCKFFLMAMISVTVKYVSVPKEKGNRVIRRLLEEGVLRKDRKIVEAGNYLIIPVTDAPPETFQRWGLSVESGRKTPSRGTLETPFEKIRNELDFAKDLDRLLPRRWEMLGDVLVLDMPEGLAGKIKEVAGAYAKILGARTVVDNKGVINGEFREPEAKMVLGNGSQTMHVENGIKYHMDPLKVMFSSGNIDERVRMARVSNPAETVVDMFAGIGYFTLPVAKHGGAKVVAYEKNPVAFAYLEKNILENGLVGKVTPLLMDNRKGSESVADRVIMGYMGGTHSFLEKGFSFLKDSGIVHYHDGFYEGDLWDVPEKFVRETAEKMGAKVEVISRRKVKSYAKRRYHVVLDIRVEKR